MFAASAALLLQAAAPELAAAPAPAATETGADQKVRCRSSVVTGYLAKRQRVCKTVAEWRRSDREASANGERMTNQGLVSHQRRGE